MVLTWSEFEQLKDGARNMGRLFARSVASQVLSEIRGIADGWGIEDEDLIYELFDAWIEGFYDRICNIAYNTLIH